ncbi:MAG: glycosyltransferase [Ignavibacteriales bacterium]|nr:glycosyltransferase [Ignavibacteriales bacterium]
MKICFYLHYTENTSGGINTYSKSVLNLLLGSQDIKKVYLVFSKESAELVKSLLNSVKLIPLPIERKSKPNTFLLLISHLTFDIYNILINYGINRRKIKFLKKISSWINPYRKISSLSIDLVHIPLRFSPIYGLDIPLITTMHDLQELIMPENFSAGERLHRALNSKKAIDESDQIIVSFNHVKEDVKKYFGFTDDQVSVCPPPFS